MSPSVSVCIKKYYTGGLPWLYGEVVLHELIDLTNQLLDTHVQVAINICKYLLVDCSTYVVVHWL